MIKVSRIRIIIPIILISFIQPAILTEIENIDNKSEFNSYLDYYSAKMNGCSDSAKMDDINNHVLPGDLKEEISIQANKIPVIFVSYASLSCYHCSEFYADILPEIKKNLERLNIYTIFIERYIATEHPSLLATMIINCNKISSKDKSHITQVLFNTNMDWATRRNEQSIINEIKNILSNIQISPDTVDACIKSYDEQVELFKVYYDFMIDAGVHATPTQYISGERYEGLRSIDSYINIVSRRSLELNSN